MAHSTSKFLLQDTNAKPPFLCFQWRWFFLSLKPRRGRYMADSAYHEGYIVPNL